MATGDLASKNGVSNGNNQTNGKSSDDKTTTAITTTTTTSWWKRSRDAALRGGTSGSIAMVLQVVLLMWLRTIVNYQYRHGVDARTAMATLYEEGGLLRFYKGASLALLTGPVARFGDTAANEGVKEFFRGGSSRLPVWATTLTASLVAALWRVAITPLDTLKTTLQVGSSEGLTQLWFKVTQSGLGVLWAGALGNMMATLAGHYPWFIVYNFLDGKLPVPEAGGSTASHTKRKLLCRRALLGFCSSFVSDCFSNGIRVVKTYQQTAPTPLTMAQAFSELLAANGPAFAVRGLRLKILSNGLSGILFAVLWKMIQERLRQRQTAKQERAKESSKTKQS